MTKAVLPVLAQKSKKQEGMNGVLLSFLLGAAGAFFILLPFWLVDKGLFLYAGDYNSQQIPFYMYVQQFIKDGGGTWSWATDLGSSVINSYSFYNIGSPFLWVTMLLPSRWLPYLMVPLFCLKFGCIAAAANLYLSRYAKTRNMAVICSVIYAFCGFNIYNIFFNHMLDPVAIFPLILWALDGFILEKRRGWFAIFVGLALLNSFFFFVGNVVFLLLYFFVKVWNDEYRITPSEFGLLALETAIGVGIGMMLALPSFYNLVGNPRTNNFASGFDMVLYGNVQQYFAIFTSILFPPDPPYLPNLFTEGAIRWTSMSAFLPIVSVAGVVAYCRGRRRSWVKTLLGICFVCALVPFLNSAFYAFNASYYARWYYMPILLMCLATLYSLEDGKADLLHGARVALALTAVYVVFGLLPKEEDGSWVLGVAKYASKFWLTLLMGLLGIGIFYALVRVYRKKVRFGPLLLSAVMGFSVFYSVVHLALGKFPQWTTDANYTRQMYQASAEIELPEDGFYRIDTFGSYDNLGLWLNKSCLQTFNSVVTPSIMEFYPMVGVKRDVSSKPEATNYALRGLLNVKYTLVPLNKIEVPIEEIPATREELGVSEDQYSIAYSAIPIAYRAENLKLEWAVDVGSGNAGALGWQFYKIEGGYAIFENENYLPLGFTYDQYIAMDNLLLATESDRAPLLVRAIGLTQEQEEKYGYLFEGEVGNFGQADFGQAEPETGLTQSSFQYETVGYSGYVADASSRREEASYETSADSSGFTARIYLQKENLVFFGVPYDSGFTATVNGQEAEVLEVSGGMMAVYAPAGDNEIVFRYKTPGFGLGLALSLLSLAALCVYLVLYARFKKNHAARQSTVKPAPAAGALPGAGQAPEAALPAEESPPAAAVQAEEKPQGEGEALPQEKREEET
ncbi:MAG: YfhO family protein [Oscillospiraceae bacterium]